MKSFFSTTAWLGTVLLLSACQRDGLRDPDPSDKHDAQVPTPKDLSGQDTWDFSVEAELPVSQTDLSPSPDFARPPDLTPLPDLTPAPDMTFPSGQNVDIHVDNFCKMDVIPKTFNVPRGTFLKLTYFNRSRDYDVDVWLSYGGGYLGLKTGTSWADRFEFCKNPRPYDAYADITTACSRFRLMIHCL